MRKLEDHMVPGDTAVQLTVATTDAPAVDGANHDYQIMWREATGYRALDIHFQKGPIKDVGVNGVTHEALLTVLIDRLRSYQSGQYSCRENAIALTHFEEGLMWLQRRTVNRIKRGVEGTRQA
jgi:hypothetical protein